MVKEKNKEGLGFGSRILLFLFFVAVTCFGVELMGLGIAKLSTDIIEKFLGLLITCLGGYMVYIVIENK